MFEEIEEATRPLGWTAKVIFARDGKYPPAKPGALGCEPLKAADWGR
jgi:hypothetical protein